MALTNINEVFAGAIVDAGDVIIPSGSLASCDLPVATDPNEIILGMLENIHQAIVAESPTYVQSTAGFNLVDSSTYRRTYSFSLDLAFNNSTILEQLDVKPEPVE